MPYERGTLSRLERKRNKLQDEADLHKQRLRAQGEIEATRLDAFTHVARRAMYDASLLSLLEGSLSQLSPRSISRLEALGDIGALSLAEMLTEAARRLQS
jgi:hypothetical protein